MEGAHQPCSCHIYFWFAYRTSNTALRTYPSLQVPIKQLLLYALGTLHLANLSLFGVQGNGLGCGSIGRKDCHTCERSDWGGGCPKGQGAGREGRDGPREAAGCGIALGVPFMHRRTQHSPRMQTPTHKQPLAGLGLATAISLLIAITTHFTTTGKYVRQEARKEKIEEKAVCQAGSIIVATQPRSSGTLSNQPHSIKAVASRSHIIG